MMLREQVTSPAPIWTPVSPSAIVWLDISAPKPPVTETAVVNSSIRLKERSGDPTVPSTPIPVEQP